MLDYDVALSVRMPTGSVTTNIRMVSCASGTKRRVKLNH